MTSSGFPLGFLGAGNMAEAIARSIITKQLARPEEMFASDPYGPRRALFATLGLHVSADNADVVRNARTVMLCCKPQMMKAVLESVKGTLSADALVVSIAAGVSIGNIREALGRPGQKVVRVMPNTPLMVGAGMSAIAPGAGVGSEDVAVVRGIFEVAGKVVEVTEDLMDAVTAVSGSGPAYYFLLTEHLAKQAVALGLDPASAQLLARQTALGSALMLTESTDSPEELRRKVTSPGGTTQAAIEHMEKHDLPAIFRAGVEAACRRGRELREAK